MGGFKKIIVGVLTSSRADFGIYLPLLKRMREDETIDLRIIAFGTHVKPAFGETKKDILQNGFSIYAEIDSLSNGDLPADIASGFAQTAELFGTFWATEKMDVVFCLGDRFEMAAAVISGLPFQIKFAHIHGGETTLGAIDNAYRHMISHASTFHFVTAEAFKTRLEAILDETKYIAVTGSLSLDNLLSLPLLSKDAFFEKWQIDLSISSLLVTIHPETIAHEANKSYCAEALSALSLLANQFQIIITLPNADTMGSIYRNAFIELGKSNPDKIKIIENFGSQSYFTCMKYCAMLVGNTSSGIIEAASFGRYVINLGERQRGRLARENVIHLPFDAHQIIEATQTWAGKEYSGINPYFQPNAAATLLDTLKHWL
jgi:GDP/UDP-N,N'-diacetylbacillosamine 2-epimerase (hydrolysing)